MEQKNFYSHIPYSHNVPYRFLGRNSVHFGRPLLHIIAMEQHTLKNVNNCLNINIYSYLETSGVCTIILFTAVIYGFS